MAINKVAFLGMMASGKTTIGKALAERLALPFRDSDRELEERAGMSVAEFFARRGEEAFRALELATIRELLARPEPFLMALGGGAYMQPAIREELRGKATTVYLKVGADELVSRLEATDIASRPLLASSSDWRRRTAELTAARDAIYVEADVVFAAGDRDVEAMAGRLMAILAAREDLAEAFTGVGHA